MTGLWSDAGSGETQANLQLDVFDAGEMRGSAFATALIARSTSITFGSSLLA